MFSHVKNREAFFLKDSHLILININVWSSLFFQFRYELDSKQIWENEQEQEGKNTEKKNDEESFHAKWMKVSCINNAFRWTNDTIRNANRKRLVNIRHLRAATYAFSLSKVIAWTYVLNIEWRFPRGKTFKSSVQWKNQRGMNVRQS